MSRGYLPSRPLHDLVVEVLAGQTSLASTVGVSQRQLFRWRAGARVRVATADRVAVACGRHPIEVWPDDW